MVRLAAGAYIVGATIDHALWVLIHECTHSLVFRRPAPNKLAAIVANLPLVFPAAASFARFHLLHHRHLGEMDYDADIPGPVESRIIRTSMLKAAWLAAFGAVQGLVRTHRLKKVSFFDRWIVANIIVQVSAVAALYAWLGFRPLMYLTVSSIAAIGLHPLGARWIQEHFVFAEDQETYSYYGPLNRVCFNMGYHNEHHDFVTVPWSRLPKLKAAAPEFYDTLLRTPLLDETAAPIHFRPRLHALRSRRPAQPRLSARSAKAFALCRILRAPPAFGARGFRRAAADAGRARGR